MKWNLKNNLDEMQEMKLSKIEKGGCWFAFWALFAVMMIQLAVFNATIRELAGEWIVFMCLALYLAIACLKAGIWDRHIPATPRANLVASLLAGIVVWVLNICVMMHNHFFDHTKDAVLAAGFTGFFTAVLCMIVMTIFTVLYKKRVENLEKEPEEIL